MLTFEEWYNRYLQLFSWFEIPSATETIKAYERYTKLQQCEYIGEI